MMLRQGSDRMRQEQQSITAAPCAVEFKFRFQMTNAGARHACSVTIKAINEVDAATIFSANWNTIEQLARRNLIEHDQRDIRLDAAIVV
jgi:hypothetical protein